MNYIVSTVNSISILQILFANPKLAITVSVCILIVLKLMKIVGKAFKLAILVCVAYILFNIYASGVV